MSEGREEREKERVRSDIGRELVREWKRGKRSVRVIE